MCKIKINAFIPLKVYFCASRNSKLLSKINITNISGLQFFQLLRFGTLLLISIVFTKTTVGTEAIGNYEYFLFVAALACSFWINGIIQSFLPLFHNNNSFNSKNEKSAEFFNVFVLISLLSVGVVLVLAAFHLLYSDLPYFSLLLLYILLSSPAFLVEYVYLLKNKVTWIIGYGIITFAVQFVIVAGPAFLGWGMRYSIMGLVVISAIRYIWLLTLLKKYARFSLSFAFLKEHISLATPLVVSSLMGASAQYVDGFLVLNKYDTATFAVFRYGAKEFPLVVLMANAMSTALIPEFSSREKIKDSLKILRDKTKRLAHFLFPVTIVFIVFSQWLYPRVFNPDFADSAIIFNIYLLLIISRLVFPHTLLIGLKKTKVVMYASLAELLVNIVLSVLFIRFWGIEGVAFATVIAFGVQKIIWVVYNKTVLNIAPREYIPVPLWVIYSLLILLAFIIVY